MKFFLPATVLATLGLASSARIEARDCNSTVPTHFSSATPPWLTLPPTPTLPEPYTGYKIHVNDIDLWYGVFDPEDLKCNTPVIFFHGGSTSSRWWGSEIEAVRQSGRKVIAMDSRAQGRSSSNGTLTYDLMTADALSMMDHLKIDEAALVGWSDGGIIALDMLLNHPERVERAFIYGANYNTDIYGDDRPDPLGDSLTPRLQKEFREMQPSTASFDKMSDLVDHMQATQPNYTTRMLADGKASKGKKIWIVDGQFEEYIPRVQPDVMASSIPWAGELIIPQVSHYGLIQNPKRFSAAILDLLTDDYVDS